MQFFYDLLNIHEISERFFKDVKLPRKIKSSWFCISDKNIDNSIKILKMMNPATCLEIKNLNFLTRKNP